MFFSWHKKCINTSIFLLSDECREYGSILENAYSSYGYQIPVSLAKNYKPNCVLMFKALKKRKEKHPTRGIQRQQQ